MALQAFDQQGLAVPFAPFDETCMMPQGYFSTDLKIKNEWTELFAAHKETTAIPNVKMKIYNVMSTTRLQVIEYGPCLECEQGEICVEKSTTGVCDQMYTRDITHLRLDLFHQLTCNQQSLFRFPQSSSRLFGEPAAKTERGTTFPTSLILGPGKVITIGARSAESTNYSVSLLCMELSRVLQKTITAVPIQIRNMVGSTALPLRFDLDALTRDLGASQTRRKFPSVNYKPDSTRWPSVTLVVFQVGKVIIIGARSEEMVQEAFYHAYPTLVKLAIDTTAEVQVPFSQSEIREMNEADHFMGAEDEAEEGFDVEQAAADFLEYMQSTREQDAMNQSDE